MDVIKNFFKNRKKIILDRAGKKEYLIRYYLFLKNRTWFPFNFTLHKICQSDEPALHDHPWPFISIILKGGYWEWTEKGKKWKGPGRITFSGSNRYHRLQLGQDKWHNTIPCWSLFFMGPKRRDWGFKNEDGVWISNDEYLTDKKKDEIV